MFGAPNALLKQIHSNMCTNMLTHFISCDSSNQFHIPHHLRPPPRPRPRRRPPSALPRRRYVDLSFGLPVHVVSLELTNKYGLLTPQISFLSMRHTKLSRQPNRRPPRRPPLRRPRLRKPPPRRRKSSRPRLRYVLKNDGEVD